MSHDNCTLHRDQVNEHLLKPYLLLNLCAVQYLVYRREIRLALDSRAPKNYREVIITYSLQICKGAQTGHYTEEGGFCLTRLTFSPQGIYLNVRFAPNTSDEKTGFFMKTPALGLNLTFRNVPLVHLQNYSIHKCTVISTLQFLGAWNECSNFYSTVSRCCRMNAVISTLQFFGAVE